MGYVYSTATLLHKVDSSTNAHSENVLTGEGVIAFGELLQMTIEIGHSAPADVFQTGRFYIFNPCLFTSTQYTTALPTSAEGYLLSVTGTPAALLCSVQLIGVSSATPAAQNLTLTATIDATDKVMTLVITFYATTDTKSYLGQNFIGNELRFQSSSVIAPNYTVSTSDIYGATQSYIEWYMYEADLSNSYLPNYTSGIHADPYVRDTSNLAVKQLSRSFLGKFFDNEVGNIQAINVGDTVDYNSLFGMKVADSVGNAIAQYVRKSYPYLDANIDNNFNLIFGQQPSLIHNGYNTLSFTIKEGIALGFTTNNASISIIDCTKFRNTSQFPNEYAIDKVAIALGNDTTPAPNWYNGGTSFFGTPKNLSTGTSTVLSITLDGNKLILGHKYRFLIHLYDASGIVSAHVSPAFLVADLEEFNRPPTTGSIETLFDTFTGNDVSLAPFERVRLSIKINAASYATFANDIRSISLVSSYADGSIVTSTYNFPNQTAINQPMIEYSNVGALHTFACSFRPKAIPPFTSSSNSTHKWIIVYDQTLSNGSMQTVITEFEQRLTVRALDTPARFTNIRILDYSEFQIGNIVELNQLCTDDDRAVVEVEKSIVASANLIALFFTADPTTQPNYAVDEDESFASSSNLVAVTGTYIENTDATFTANLAYYEIDLTLLNQSSVYYYGAIIKEI